MTPVAEAFKVEASNNVGVGEDKQIVVTNGKREAHVWNTSATSI